MNSSGIAQAYDAVADDYARTRAPAYGLDYLERFRDLLPAGGTVLDAGCGTGLPMDRHLSEHGLRVHGIDISPRMIELARRNVPEVVFEVADMIDWAMDPGVDGILAWDSYFHLQPEHHVPVLRRFHRMLAPGGVLMMTVGGIEGEMRSSMLGREFYYSSMSRKAYEDALFRIGYEIAFMEDDQPGQNHVVVFARTPPGAVTDLPGDRGKLAEVRLDRP